MKQLISRCAQAIHKWAGDRHDRSRMVKTERNASLHIEALEHRQLLSSNPLTTLSDTVVEGAIIPTIQLTPISADPSSSPAELAAYFQQLLDGPSRVVDLGGQTWVVPSRIIISTQHSGKVIQNGTIKFTFEGDVPRMGGMEIVQGRKWYNAEGRTVMYPEGDIDLTLRDLVLDGDFPYDFGLQEHTEAEADRMGKGFNLITTITRAANNINLSRVRFQNSGNSAIAGSFRTFIAQDISAHKVAKHVIGLRGFGGTKAQINRLEVTQSGNVIDFHNEADFYDEDRPDVAVVRNLYAQNIRGRSKVAGNNWSIDGSNWWFEQENVVNMNLFPAFDLSKNPRRFVVDGFVAINFPAMGIGTLADDRGDGVICLRNVFIRDSLSGIKVQQRVLLENAEFMGVSCPFQSSTPRYQVNTVETEHTTDAQWGVRFNNIHALYDAKNAQWGTNYTPYYWAPPGVRDLIG